MLACKDANFSHCYSNAYVKCNVCALKSWSESLFCTVLPTRIICLPPPVKPARFRTRNRRLLTQTVGHQPTVWYIHSNCTASHETCVGRCAPPYCSGHRTQNTVIKHTIVIELLHGEALFILGLGALHYILPAWTPIQANLSCNPRDARRPPQNKPCTAQMICSPQHNCVVIDVTVSS